MEFNTQNECSETSTPELFLPDDFMTFLSFTIGQKADFFYNFKPFKSQDCPDLPITYSLSSNKLDLIAFKITVPQSLQEEETFFEFELIASQGKTNLSIPMLFELKCPEPPPKIDKSLFEQVQTGSFLFPEYSTELPQCTSEEITYKVGLTENLEEESLMFQIVTKNGKVEVIQTIQSPVSQKIFIKAFIEGGQAEINGPCILEALEEQPTIEVEQVLKKELSIFSPDLHLSAWIISTSQLGLL